jgi:hypothetical protein
MEKRLSAFDAIRFTPHARKRRQTRKISRDQIEATLRDPDTVELGYLGRLVSSRRTETGRILRVVYEEQLTVEGRPWS